jgi:hypothetical protein
MPSEEREGGTRWLWLLIPLLLLLAYVLSVGPVELLWDRMGWEKAWLRGVYAPLVWLHGNTQLRRPLERYEKLWIGR